VIVLRWYLVSVSFIFYILLTDEKASADTKQQFANCVCLYAELIHADIFSHDMYVCTLISRGDVANAPPPPPPSNQHNDSGMVSSDYHQHGSK